MPQLNPEFFISQLFWLAVFFSFLLIFLWRVSLPRIAKVLEKRQSKIDDDLSSAKELQEQAQQIEKNINDQINKAKENANEELKKTISSLQDEVSSKLSILDKELEEKISKSEKDILWKGKNEFKGLNAFFDFLKRKSYKIQYRVMLSKYRSLSICKICFSK